MKRISFTFLALCAALSLFLGRSLSDLQQSAKQLVDTLYPVAYDVTYSDMDSGERVLLSNVQVRFSEDTAMLSTGESIPVSGTHFVCLDEDAYAKNISRTAAASLGLVLISFVLLLGMTAVGVRFCLMALRTDARRRANAKRRAARRNAACGSVSPIRPVAHRAAA